MPEDAEGIAEHRVMTFWEHMEELANRLKVVLLVLFASTVAMMILPANIFSLKNPQTYEPLVGVVLRSIREQVLPQDARLIGLELTVPIQLYLLTSFVLGLAVTVPVLGYEIYRFVNPALYPHERRDVWPFAASVSVLFITGALFGYKVLTPYLIWSMFLFFPVVGAEMLISIMDFYHVVFITTLVTGLTFTFPAFFVLLVKYGVLSTSLFRRNRIYLYAGLFIFAMILTPDGGFPMGNLMIWIPMVLLIETGILFARRYEKGGELPRVPWLPESPVCKFCGAAIPASTAFCPHCGRSQR